MGIKDMFWNMSEVGYDALDSGVRLPCRLIDASGWVKVQESCEGHDRDMGDNDRLVPGGCPYLRLETAAEDMGRLLYLIEQAFPVEHGMHMVARVSTGFLSTRETVNVVLHVESFGRQGSSMVWRSDRLRVLAEYIAAERKNP